MKSKADSVCKVPGVVSGAHIGDFLINNSHTFYFLVVESCYMGKGE